MRNILQAVFCAALLLQPMVGAAANPELGQQLYESVLYMDTAKVKELLAAGADANHTESNRCVLAWAAQNGALEIVEALLAAGANQNVVDGVGHTPLMRAIETQKLDVVKALLKAKPDLSIRAREGVTVALMAVKSRKPEIVKALLDAGADFNATDENGESPALTAALEGGDEMLEVIKLLGAARVDLNKSNLVYTPLFYAVDQGNKELVKALLDAGANPNAATEGGRTPLSEATTEPEILGLLLSAKADPNITNARGEPALFTAIENDSAAAVEALIKAGADVNKRDQSGSSPLTYANNMYKTEIAEILKKNGATE